MVVPFLFDRLGRLPGGDLGGKDFPRMPVGSPAIFQEQDLCQCCRRSNMYYKIPFLLE